MPNGFSAIFSEGKLSILVHSALTVVAGDDNGTQRHVVKLMALELRMVT